MEESKEIARSEVIERRIRRIEMKAEEKTKETVAKLEENKAREEEFANIIVWIGNALKESNRVQIGEAVLRYNDEKTFLDFKGKTYEYRSLLEFKNGIRPFLPYLIYHASSSVARHYNEEATNGKAKHVTRNTELPKN